MSTKQMRDVLTIVAFLAILAVLPAFLASSRYLMSVLMNCIGVAVIATGVWITFLIGRTNICQAGFALIGAYVAAIAMVRYGWSYWVALPLAALLAGLAGTLIGCAVLKLKGIYFAMLTICLTEAIRLAFLNGGDFTHGSKGITDIPQPFAPTDVLTPYYLGLALLAIAFLIAYRIHYSRLGSIFRAMRLNEDLAESFGVNVWRYRILAFTLACVLAGIGGSYFALMAQSVYPQSFTVEHSIYYLLYCFLGGLDFVSGAALGVFVLTILFELLQAFQQYQSLVYGVLMIVVMLILPNGLLALRRRERATTSSPKLSNSAKVSDRDSSAAGTTTAVAAEPSHE